MTGRPLKNIAHSVHQRLLNKARQAGRPFNELLQYYAMERFLYRLSRSPHADRFVLKGALMLRVWRAPATRPTRDIDLLGHMENTPDTIAQVIREVSEQKVEPDGMQFDPDGLHIETIREATDYTGVRGLFQGRLGNARVHMQVDVGFGDAVSPPAGRCEYPTILDLPAPFLRCYSRESSIAEKFHAMVKLGELNSRMSDFYDIWLLSRHFQFEAGILGEAIQCTFGARDTGVPEEPVAFTEAFASAPDKQRLWATFRRKSRIEVTPREFAELSSSIARFLAPVVQGLAQGAGLEAHWTPPGPWR